MKKLLIIIIAIMFSVISNAQYLQNHNVNIIDYSLLTKEQLNLAYDKAEKNVDTGKILVGAGAGVTLLGTIIYVASLNAIIESTDYDYSSELSGSTAGALIAGTGGIMVAIGIPVWISGKNKTETIEIHLQKFTTGNQTSISGIGLTYNF